MKTIIEPHRVKMVEPIRLTDRDERERLIEKAHYNLFLLHADDVIIDLLTDSGTSAMSSEAWGAMMRGDESYAGARSWYRFRDTVKDIFGFEQVVPTHQGRAAERILFSVMVEPGSVVPNNTHFDTKSDAPFKGNMDIAALEKLVAEEGPGKIPLIMVTITNNSGGGQPVSMANIREISRIAREVGIPFYVDACRFAENAYFIKLREPGYENSSVIDIAREIFALADGCTMSAKKDAFANIGGFLCTNDAELAQRERNILILTEGFPTYGGLAGRDLEAIAVGLREILDEHYLDYRLLSTRYVVNGLLDSGIPVVAPAGGHAVYLDARRFLPHIEPVMFGMDPHSGTEQPARSDLVRLAIPRRVYTQSHMDYVLEAIQYVWERRDAIRGMRIVEAPQFLRHFTAHFAWL
jgi:tryptophanase